MKAAIYNRCSTEEEAQINALAIQVEESREKVLSKGWEIITQYIESESGTTSYKRSEYQRLMDDMETDLFDVVVIKSIDRLMRSAKDWYVFLDKLTQNNKKLYIYIDNKFYMPEDSLITGIKAILAEDFSRELSKKIKNAHRRRQEKKTGLNITTPMFGWDKVGKDTFIINEEEAKAYKEAFRLAEEGKGFYTIAGIMYQNGVRSKRGNRISESQWRKMLYSPRAYGTVVLHQKEYDFEAKKMKNLPESEWVYIENALPPIVSKEYQLKVIKQLLSRTISENEKQMSGNRKNAGRYLLSGKLLCGECGEKFYRITSKSKNTQLIEWKCSKALKCGRNRDGNTDGCNNIPVIEDAVLEQIERACKKNFEVIFSQDDYFTNQVLQVIRKILSEGNSKKEEEQIKKELEKCEKRKRVLLNKLADEIISDEDFRALNEELSHLIEKKREKLNSIIAREKEYSNIEEKMLKIKQTLNDGIIDRAKTKALISRINRIVVHANGTIELEFDKWKLLNLLKIYNAGFAEEELEEGRCRLIIAYEHKTNTVRRKEEIKKEILAYFRENPNHLLKDLYSNLGVSQSYMDSCVKSLKQNGRLRYKRQGNHRGEWIVVDE